jgi:uncharacterized protein (TIGR01244 family)
MGNTPRDTAEIVNWHRIDDRLTTSGQPSAEQLRDIADLGVTHVINLGLHDHEKALPDEATLVRKLGMTYVHIPVDFGNPTEVDFQRFRAAMGGIAGAVHVHCIANLRVAAFLYRYRREDLGVSEETARRDMERLWRPGGIWAHFIRDGSSSTQPHRLSGVDY